MKEYNSVNIKHDINLFGERANQSMQCMQSMYAINVRNHYYHIYHIYHMTELNTGAKGIGKVQSSDSTTLPKLTDLGITKYETVGINKNNNQEVFLRL